MNHNNVGKNMSGTNGLTKAERPDNIGNVFLLKSSEKHRTEKGNQNPATNFQPILCEIMLSPELNLNVWQTQTQLSGRITGHE